MSARDCTDIANYQDIKSLVDAFYSHIRADAMLGPMFTDVAKVDWVVHLPVLCEFWESVLFALPGYKGDPIKTHTELHDRLTRELGIGLTEDHFDHWVAMFSRTIDDLFQGPTAEKAKRNAARMANQLLTAIEQQS